MKIPKTTEGALTKSTTIAPAEEMGFKMNRAKMTMMPDRKAVKMRTTQQTTTKKNLQLTINKGKAATKKIP